MKIDKTTIIFATPILGLAFLFISIGMSVFSLHESLNPELFPLPLIISAVPCGISLVLYSFACFFASKVGASKSYFLMIASIFILMVSMIGSWSAHQAIFWRDGRRKEERTLGRIKGGRTHLFRGVKKLSPTFSGPKRMQSPMQFIDGEGHQQVVAAEPGFAGSPSMFLHNSHVSIQ